MENLNPIILVSEDPLKYVVAVQDEPNLRFEEVDVKDFTCPKGHIVKYVDANGVKNPVQHTTDSETCVECQSEFTIL